MDSSRSGHVAADARPARPITPLESLPAPELMALRRLSHPVLGGMLEVFPAGALLSLFNLQKVTGILYLQDRTLSATIHMAAGEVVGATLGPESGLAALFHALSWNTGRFYFRPESPGPRTINVSLPVLQMRATLWLDSWKDLRRCFPTIWYRVGIHPQPSGEVIIQPHQWQLLTRIVAQPASLVQLAGQLHLDVLAVTRLAVELVTVGLAIVIPPEEEADGPALGSDSP